MPIYELAAWDLAQTMTEDTVRPVRRIVEARLARKRPGRIAREVFACRLRHPIMLSQPRGNLS